MGFNFKNEAWAVSEDRESYFKTLKAIRAHKPLPRIDLPTTTILFVSRFTDSTIRQFFEDSSRHFKTYNLYADMVEFFASPKSEKSNTTRTPSLVFDLLEFVLRISFLGNVLSKFLSAPQKAHLSYRKYLRSMDQEQLSNLVVNLYQTIGLTDFTKINVIVADKNDRDSIFGIRFLCELLGNENFRKALNVKNLQVPDDYQTFYGIFDQVEKSLKYYFISPVNKLNVSLLRYLENKTHAVMNRIKVKDLVKTQNTREKRTLILGRRILTRGHETLNENSLIQSYDYKYDIDLKRLCLLLKSAISSYRRSNANSLIVIESLPTFVKELIFKDEELKHLLNGNEIALACVEPNTKDIFIFEGDQFNLKNF